MAVHKQFEACEEQRESDACYDYIADTEAEKNVQQEPWLNLVVQFTNMQEDHIRERALEVKYLEALGINAVDSTLALDLECISLIQ
jgi:hypothetical protein